MGAYLITYAPAVFPRYAFGLVSRDRGGAFRPRGSFLKWLGLVSGRPLHFALRKAR